MKTFIRISKQNITDKEKVELFKMLDELGLQYYEVREIEK